MGHRVMMECPHHHRPQPRPLKPPHHIIERMRHMIVAGSVGRVAIKLATESVFGEDIMATVGPNEKGLQYIYVA